MKVSKIRQEIYNNFKNKDKIWFKKLKIITTLIKFHPSINKYSKIISLEDI